MQVSEKHGCLDSFGSQSLCKVGNPPQNFKHFDGLIGAGDMITM